MSDIFPDNKKVLFLGGSLTECGRDREDPASLGTGYPRRISDYLKILKPDMNVWFVNKGISGARVRDISDRFEEDVLKEQPDMVSVLIGINDVWRRYDSNDPCPDEYFREKYESLLISVKKFLPETKILIMEPFLIHIYPEQMKWREDLDPKIQIVRGLAQKYADYFIPLDGIISAESVRIHSAGKLSADGVHLTDTGHALIAREFIRALQISL